MKLKDALREILTEDELRRAPASYDTVGDIAIVELDPALRPKERFIGDAMLKNNPKLKVVLEKGSAREGTFRTKSYVHMAGENRTETTHAENGCSFVVDVASSYFSPRESTERMRVASQVSPTENVLVMFAGVGPFAVVIAKKARPAKVVAIEINPDAYDCMEKNIKLNKQQQRVIPILGDVREALDTYYGQFDRVVMPLPQSAHEFLDVALAFLRKDGGIVHLYGVGREEEPYGKLLEALKGAGKSAGRSVKILEKRRVLPYAPRTWKVCVDAKFGPIK